MVRYPLSGLRVRLAITVAASFALLIALAATALYLVLRRQWRAEVDGILRQSAEAAQGLFSSELLEYRSPQATVVHIVSELVFGDRTVVALDSTNTRLAKSRPIGGAPDIWTSHLDRVTEGPATLRSPSGTTRAMSVHLTHGYRLVIAFPMAPVEARLDNLQLVLGLGFVFSVVVGTFVAVLASRRALRPITNTALVADQVSEAIAQGRLPHPAIAAGTKSDEVGRLQNAFSVLVTRLNEAFVREREAATHQRRFFADAAHELRTPIAILQNEIGIALNGGTGADRDTLLRLGNEVDHLTRLVGDLLLLARGESAADLTGQTVYLDDIASAALLRAGRYPVAAGRQIGVGQFDAVSVRGDPALLERAIICLIENALLHAAPSDIEVSVGTDAGIGAWIAVSDGGDPIPAGSTERIFERFVRLKQDTPGSGLGLAIVRRIAELHGGTLVLSQETLPTRKSFIIRIPTFPAETNGNGSKPSERAPNPTAGVSATY